MDFYKSLTAKKLFFIFSFLCLFINLLQSYYTEILGDEAYYYLYSKYLAWGYYDHPPMIAWLIGLSSIFFDGNLGVRFVTVFLQLATLGLIWLQLDKSKETEKQTVVHFFLISSSLVMFIVYGFITTPDAPLLFFTALFLYTYKQFLEKSISWNHTFLMAIALAGMVYSKYQSVLVIGFVLFSNISILKNRKFLLAILVAIILTIPHIHWQYQNDFPSLKYHLIGRQENFRWLFLLEYIPNQLLAFNPFTLIAVVYVLYKYRAVDKFEKALYYLIIGFILFFAIMTLRGHAQPQWTVAASIPMIILLHQKMKTDIWLRKYAYKYIGGSLILIFIARILLVTNLIPEQFEFSGKQKYYEAIDKIAGTKPVIFVGSYRYPALYTFFTGKKSISVASTIRGNHQFEIWKFEKDFYDKPTFVVGNIPGKSNILIVNNQKINGFFVDSIQTTESLAIKYVLKNKIIKKGNEIKIDFTIANNLNHRINFYHTDFNVRIHLILINKYGEIYDIEGQSKNNLTILAFNQKIENEITFKIPDVEAGKYTLALGCSSTFGTTLNSEIEEITILN